MEDLNLHVEDDIEMALLCDQALVCGDIHPELENDPTSSNANQVKSQASHEIRFPPQEKEVIFAKTRGSDGELYPVQMFFFLLGSIKIWLDFEMKVIPNRYLNGGSTHSADNTKSQQYFMGNILRIQSKTDKHLSLKFGNEATFLEWHDIVLQSLAQIVINSAFRQSHIRKELRAMDLFDLISRCDPLVSGEFPDLMRARELIAMKQQLSYWVNGWRTRRINAETMLCTIESFMKRIMLERLDPLIVGKCWL